MRLETIGRWALTGLLALACSAPAMSEAGATTPRAVLEIPRLSAAPRLEAFLEMLPASAPENEMARVDGFVQRSPSDGGPSSLATHAYLGFDDEHLYVVFVAYDPEPAKLHAHRLKREAVFEVNDDAVELRLDTFDDRRRSFYFVVNPLGVQLDALWPEVGGEYDESFDTVWRSDGRLTEHGYVAMMSIPFRSLRFPNREEQRWGIYLARWMPRRDEWVFWPRVSAAVDSYLEQAAELRGIEGVSAGLNAQLVPFVFARDLDASSVDGSAVEERRSLTESDLGLDAKLVVGGRWTVDATVNPDFSQVESDAPQVTVNRRFEVFFPEKRPFFLENAGYFDTPIDLVFTRRIADPRFGLRVTGKSGPTNVAAFVVDDEAPGRLLPALDAAAGEVAHVGLLRVSQDLGAQSSLGGIFTQRTFGGGSNQVAGLDAFLRLSEHWSAELQAVASRTVLRDGSELAGPAYEAAVHRRGRHVGYEGRYRDRAESFRTEVGFDPRQGIRSTSQFWSYRWWPEGRVVSWGPEVEGSWVWDRGGRLLDWNARTGAVVALAGQFELSAYRDEGRVLLDPVDYPALPAPRSFDTERWGGGLRLSRPSLSVALDVALGEGIHFEPAEDLAPEVGDELVAEVAIGLRPLPPLRFDLTYLLADLAAFDGTDLLRNRIARLRTSWQFTRELSARVIVQHERTRADPTVSAREPVEDLTADLLVTWLWNPWTALNVGYGELDRELGAGSSRHGRPAEELRQAFVKLTYLIRP